MMRRSSSRSRPAPTPRRSPRSTPPPASRWWRSTSCRSNSRLSLVRVPWNRSRSLAIRISAERTRNENAERGSAGPRLWLRLRLRCRGSGSPPALGNGFAVTGNPTFTGEKTSQRASVPAHPSRNTLRRKVITVFANRIFVRRVLEQIAHELLPEHRCRLRSPHRLRRRRLRGAARPAGGSASGRRASLRAA